jgi:hypothetical protein
MISASAGLEESQTAAATAVKAKHAVPAKPRPGTLPRCIMPHTL